MSLRLFAFTKTKTHISCTVTAQLISAFVFAIRIVESLFYLIPKFQGSSHLLWLYSPVCIGPGRKPRSNVFLTTRLICLLSKKQHLHIHIKKCLSLIRELKEKGRINLMSYFGHVNYPFRLGLVFKILFTSYWDDNDAAQPTQMRSLVLVFVVFDTDMLKIGKFKLFG